MNRPVANQRLSGEEQDLRTRPVEPTWVEQRIGMPPSVAPINMLARRHR
ncbi:hypothetical protein [Granulicella sp. L60]|nr:hypothetical protein [Granulicella sp. L60]